MQRFPSLIVISLAIAAIGSLTALATFSHGYQNGLWPSVLATLAAWLAIVPGPWIVKSLSNGVAKQLAIVVWRLLILLGCLIIAGGLEGDARKCFFISLLACYFAGLPLESWLLIGNVRRERET
jgi:hypothetical protein